MGFLHQHNRSAPLYAVPNPFFGHAPFRPLILYRVLTALVCVCSVGGQSTESPHIISPLLHQNTNPSNAGIFLRLMPTGLAYLREIGMKVLNDEILKISLPTITENIDAGQVSIFNAYVSKYWPPVEYSLDLAGPDTFTWAMSKMHLRASGNFEARLNGALLLPSVPIRGEFESLLGHVGLTISVRLLRSSNGAPQVRSSYCGSQIGYVDLNVRNTGVLTDFFINSFKAFLIGHFKPMVEQRICQMIENIINNDMNAILATMPLKVRINENSLDIIGQTFGVDQQQRQPATAALQPYPNAYNAYYQTRVGRDVVRAQAMHRAARAKAFGSKLTGANSPAQNITLLYFVRELRERNLVLDFSLIGDPYISYGTILMKSKGEISWQGLGGTPFYPPNVIIPPPHGVHMAEFYGTDYMANSMLYHAFRQGYMDVTVGPESSNALKDLLTTSCGPGFCLGEFLGNLGEQFPNRQVEIHFSAKKAPIMVFVENRARFRLHGRMDIYARPANASQVKVQVIKSEATITSNINLWIDRNYIVGNASIENLDFKLLETVLRDVDQSSFGDLGLFGAEFLEKLLTEILQMGLVMPSMRGVVLRSPKLTIHDRFIRVQTYFKLDESYSARVVESAVRQTILNVG